jgi:hypothetical protein
MRPFKAMLKGQAAGGYNAETVTWYTRITALGGSTSTTQKNWADALIVAIRGKSYGGGLVSLWPYIGGTIAANRVPLRDATNVGAATNSGFVDADCGDAIGTKNATEAAKYMDSLISPQNLLNLNGAANKAGMGHYERSWGAGSNVEPIGCYDASNTQRYCLDLRSTFERCRFGTTGNAGGSSSTTTNAHYYMQSTVSGGAATLAMYKDGSHLGTDFVGSEATTGAGDHTIILMGCNEAGTITPWKSGGVACHYLTDGTWSSSDIADFHTTLGTCLITPTGR